MGSRLFSQSKYLLEPRLVAGRHLLGKVLFNHISINGIRSWQKGNRIDSEHAGYREQRVHLKRLASVLNVIDGRARQADALA